MRVALRGVPQEEQRLPDNMVALHVHPDSGLLVDSEFEGAISEAFLLDQVPAQHVASTDPTEQSELPSEQVKQPIEQLF